MSDWDELGQLYAIDKEIRRRPPKNGKSGRPDRAVRLLIKVATDFDLRHPEYAANQEPKHD